MSDRDLNQSDLNRADPNRADDLQAQYQSAPTLVTSAAMDQRIMQSARVAAEARSQSREAERSSGGSVAWWPRAGALVAAFAMVGLGLNLLPRTTDIVENGFDVSSTARSIDSRVASSDNRSSDSRSSDPSANAVTQPESIAFETDQAVASSASADVMPDEEISSVSESDDLVQDTDAIGLPESFMKSESAVQPERVVQPEPGAEDIRSINPKPALKLAERGTVELSADVAPESGSADLADRSALLRSEKATPGQVSPDQSSDDQSFDAQAPDVQSSDAQAPNEFGASGAIRQLTESGQAGQRWLLSLPPQSYILILAQSESESELSGLVEALKLQSPVFIVAQREQSHYLLLHGNYPDSQLAEAAADGILAARAGALEIRTARVSEILQQIR